MEEVQVTDKKKHGGGAGHRQKNMEEVQVIDRKKHGGGAGHRQKKTWRGCRPHADTEQVQAIDRKTWRRCRS